MEGYTRISKAQAKARYALGQEFYTLPCKLRPDTRWISPCVVTEQDTHGRTWTQWHNAATFYGCTSAAGRYLAYYVKEEM